jgi:hypothetical protein
MKYMKENALKYFNDIRVLGHTVKMICWLFITLSGNRKMQMTNDCGNNVLHVRTLSVP